MIAFLQPFADWLGVTPVQLILVVAVGVGLVVGWYALKLALRIATKVFAIGCVSILLLLGGLYIVFVVAR